MQTYRVETKVPRNRTLTIQGLPFQEGERVEVIVRRREREREHRGHYPLRGKPIRYLDPFGSVAGNDWEALR